MCIPQRTLQLFVLCALCAWISPLVAISHPLTKMFKLTAVAFRSTCPAPAMPNGQAASRLRGDNAAALPKVRRWHVSPNGVQTWVSFSRWPYGRRVHSEKDLAPFWAIGRLEFRAIALKAVWRWKALVRRRREQRAASWLRIVFFRGKPQLQSQILALMIAAFVVRPFPGSQVQSS